MDVSEIAQLGAAALISAMASDSWHLVRSRLAEMFTPSDMMLSRIDDVRAEIVADVPWARPRRDLLQGDLEDRLLADVELRNRLTTLLAEVQPSVTQDSRRTIQHATADRGGTTIQAGRDVVYPPGPRHRTDE
ncbi:hypothetical protein [Micromonospora sp. DT231]|uniref:hypothetical protein n=1 Tax=Micromonospora sp. DT231 TaxID=3416526 RepID=UPI003CED0735